MRHAILLALLLVTAACSGSGDEGDGAAPTALVKLAQANRAPISESVTLYGEVERGGQNQAMLTVPVEAQVTAIDAPAGSAVRAGQLVARLKPSPASAAQIASAKADAVSTEQALARAQRLKADGLASDADVEAARAAAAGASALAKSFDLRAGQLALRATRDGYIESTGASPGDLVPAGTVIATLSGNGNMQARFGIDPELARRLRPGTSLRIEPSDGSAAFSVPIRSVSPAADPQTRLGAVLATVPASRHLAPGLPLTAKAQIAAAGSAITVPYSALLDDGGQPYVFAVSKGVAHRKDVQTGPESGDRVAIVSGLADGETVVTEGNTALEDGMKVRTK